jgi:hypothetical protein
MDDELLALAQQAQADLVEAEHAAEMAKAQFHRAVRRLHLRGASLRELAAALNLSHQRVHQIVETAGGGRRWALRRRIPTQLTCSFCGRPQRKSRKLVAGPHVYICPECVETSSSALEAGQGTETAASRCSFCGKHRHQVTGLATSADEDVAICAECLALCREILSEQLT